MHDPSAGTHVYIGHCVGANLRDSCSRRLDLLDLRLDKRRQCIPSEWFLLDTEFKQFVRPPTKPEYFQDLVMQQTVQVPTQVP